MSDTDWHGWGSGRTALHIGRLPGRRQVVLYELDSSTIRPLAYFREEADARRAMALMDQWILGGPSATRDD